MTVRILLEDQHHRPSQRLLLGVAAVAALATWLLWPMAGRKAIGVWFLALPIFVFAIRYVSGSWVRLSVHRGLSWCLKTPFGTRLGNVDLHPSDIAELRIESTLFSRLLGLTDLRIVKRDGTSTPVFRFFPGLDITAEQLHAYLEQLGRE